MTGARCFIGADPYPDLPYGGKGMRGRQLVNLPYDDRVFIAELINRSAFQSECRRPPEVSYYDWHGRHPHAVRVWSMRAGFVSPMWKCVVCRARTAIRKDDLAPILNISIENPSWGDEKERMCERCGRWARCEVHHWAPSALFADADMWPKSVLCAECHDTWHAAMKQGGGYKLAQKAHAKAPCHNEHPPCPYAPLHHCASEREAL